MDQKDREKLDRISKSLGFDESQKAMAAKAVEMSLKSMEDEDPDALIPCNCHGEYWPSKDVDVWGLCPDTRGSR